MGTKPVMCVYIYVYCVIRVLVTHNLSYSTLR